MHLCDVKSEKNKKVHSEKIETGQLIIKDNGLYNVGHIKSDLKIFSHVV